MTHEPPTHEPPLAARALTCEDALGKYAALRPELFRQLVGLKGLPGGPWKVQYKRDPAQGDLSVPVKVMHHTATVTELAGQPFDGIATVSKPETYAPFHDFALLDSSGRRPEPATAAAGVELRLEFLLRELLLASKALAGTLPAIQRQAVGSAVDTTPLTTLDVHLPVFPYWRSLKNLSEVEFDRIIAEERPLLDEARVVLRRLLTIPPTNANAAGSADDLYAKALRVIYDTCCGMEQHPRTYKGKGEEDLRDHLLSMLKSHFQSVTGETFNKRGKTDILIRQGGSHVLVAECKVWDGPKSLVGAIDQVLSYLTWRDTRAAVIMFVPNKDPTPVVRQANETIEAHSCCRNAGKEVQGGWYSFDFRLDPTSTHAVRLAVMCFHFPPA